MSRLKPAGVLLLDTIDGSHMLGEMHADGYAEWTNEIWERTVPRLRIAIAADSDIAWPNFQRPCKQVVGSIGDCGFVPLAHVVQHLVDWQ